jgi:antitoxin (DNA-binding transcriptional repressor) of toxin-antitoxin stability system
MARTVSITEAKAQLSRLLDEVEHDGAFIIRWGGRSVAVLRAYPGHRTPRQLGCWEGQVWIADDFDDLPADIAEVFGA